MAREVIVGGMSEDKGCVCRPLTIAEKILGRQPGSKIVAKPVRIDKPVFPKRKRDEEMSDEERAWRDAEAKRLRSGLHSRMFVFGDADLALSMRVNPELREP